MIEIIFFFALFGVIGVCFEVFINSIQKFMKTREITLMGYSSIWMFFIYGTSYFIILYVTTFFLNFNILIRGFIYMILFYMLEFSSGFILKKFKMIPWDYSEFKYNFKGIIALQFAPLWYIGGIFLETIYLYLKPLIF